MLFAKAFRLDDGIEVKTMRIAYLELWGKDGEMRLRGCLAAISIYGVGCVVMCAR